MGEVFTKKSQYKISLPVINHIQDFLSLILKAKYSRFSHLNTFHSEYKHGLKNFHNNSGCQNLLVQTQPQDFIIHNNSGCQILLVQLSHMTS